MTPVDVIVCLSGQKSTSDLDVIIKKKKTATINKKREREKKLQKKGKWI